MKLCRCYIKFIVFFFLLTVWQPAANAQGYCNKAPMRLLDNINNPSFEQKLSTCISFFAPGGANVSDYIPGWKVATDNNEAWYFAECNQFMVLPPQPLFPKVPLPLPDGKGAIGFFDAGGGGRAVEKTYMSNCLAKPFQKNYPYELRFSVGFGIRETKFDTTDLYKIFKPFQKLYSTSPEKITLYGHVDCNAVPFHNPIDDPLGCLSNKKGSGWIELGTCTVTGDSLSWVEAKISFISPDNINVIAIGPSCDSKTDKIFYENTFYFLDNLRLYGPPVPRPTVSIASGSLCDGPAAFATLQMDYASFYKGSQFQWYKNNTALNNETNGLLTVSKTGYGPGWYQCGVINDSVCLRSDSLFIDWITSPSSNAIGAADTTACNGDIITLNATSSNATYLWQDSATVAVRNITQSGAYSVTISNACKTITLSKNIFFKECPSAIFVPSAFSPNHDGLNDVFRARSQGVIKTFNMSVYNRSGQRIFYSTDISKGWDGTINRVMQNQGTFVWMINYTDGLTVSHSLNGTMVLIR